MPPGHFPVCSITIHEPGILLEAERTNELVVEGKNAERPEQQPRQ